MAWTKEVKEKRVSDREGELERAQKWLDGFEDQKAAAADAVEAAQVRLASFTEEELKKRQKRVRLAKRDLDWAVAAPVEGEDDEDDE